MNAPEPAEAETLLDRWFFRPLAQLLTSLVVPTPIGGDGLRILALIVGLSGASLLRYPFATQIVAGAVVLMLYAVIDRAGVELDRARDTPPRLGHVLDGVSHLLVGLVSMGAMAIHVATEGDGSGVLPVVLGFVSAALQVVFADHFTRSYPARSTAGAFDELAETEADIQKHALGLPLLRAYAVFLRAQRALVLHRDRPVPTAATAAAHAEQLRPLATVWPYLGHSTHVTLLVLLTCCGVPSAYAWLRLTLGNVVLVGLFVAQILRERALDPRPVPIAAAPAQGSPVAPPGDAEPPPLEEHRQGPISFRPPPLDE